MNIEATKDSADIEFGNDKIDLLLKPGDVKRPVVNVGEILGHHGKDKSRDTIHEEPQTKSLDNGDVNGVSVKNITWKGRINEKDNGLEADSHVLKTLTKLREMVLAEQSRNKESKPGSRFHHGTNNNNKTHHQEEDDDALKQANSIIEKVEKIHTDGEQQGNITYQEEHPDDVKYVTKAQEILKNFQSKDSNTLNNISNGTASKGNETVVNESGTMNNNKTLNDREHVFNNETDVAQSHSNETNSIGQVHNGDGNKIANEQPSKTNNSISKSAMMMRDEQKEGISKFIAETFGFDMGSSGATNTQQNSMPVKENSLSSPTSSSDIENENYQEIIARKKKKNEKNSTVTEKTADFAAVAAAEKQTEENKQSTDQRENSIVNLNTTTKNESLPANSAVEKNNVELKQNEDLKNKTAELMNNQTQDEQAKLNADQAFASTKNSTHNTNGGQQNTSSKSDEDVDKNTVGNKANINANNNENQKNNETTEDLNKGVNKADNDEKQNKDNKPSIIDGREGTNQNATLKKKEKEMSNTILTTNGNTDNKKGAKFEENEKESEHFTPPMSESMVNDKQGDEAKESNTVSEESLRTEKHKNTLKKKTSKGDSPLDERKNNNRETPPKNENLLTESKTEAITQDIINHKENPYEEETEHSSIEKNNFTIKTSNLKSENKTMVENKDSTPKQEKKPVSTVKNNEYNDKSMDYELEEVQKASEELFKELTKVDKKKTLSSLAESKVANSTVGPEEKVLIVYGYSDTSMFLNVKTMLFERYSH